MSTEQNLSPYNDNHCSPCRPEPRTKHCYEKMCKPRCKRISSLIDEDRLTIAAAKGLARHRGQHLWPPSSNAGESQFTSTGATSAMNHTDARLKVKPTLKPINDSSKVDASKKPKRKRKKRPHRKIARRTFISKSSPLSNIVYPIRIYNPLYSNRDTKASLSSRKIGRNKFQDAIGVDRIYRLKSQERIIIHEGVPKGLNAPLPHEHISLSSSNILPRALEPNACVALEETAFTSCFADMPQQHVTSPDATDNSFHWNDQRVLLAPSLSDAGSKIGSPESRYATTLSKSEQFMYSKENVKASKLRTSFFQSLKFRELQGGHRQNLDPTMHSKKVEPPCTYVYNPPLRDVNSLGREVETANQGHVASQLRLLQLAINKTDSPNITPKYWLLVADENSGIHCSVLRKKMNKRGEKNGDAMFGVYVVIEREVTTKTTKIFWCTNRWSPLSPMSTMSPLKLSPWWVMKIYLTNNEGEEGRRLMIDMNIRSSYRNPHQDYFKNWFCVIIYSYNFWDYHHYLT